MESSVGSIETVLIIVSTAAVSKITAADLSDRSLQDVHADYIVHVSQTERSERGFYRGCGSSGV